ncbi:MAG: STAS domain-containing protein [Planctomycetaceae bacterium]|nr:STAS domain-containing protein [Planctomycetaceae bacterium]
MQITPTPHDDLLELRVSGRLDAEWAATLQQAIDAAIREGYHSLVLDVAEIAYISSAGLSVLVNAHRQFQEIRGFFGVGGVTGPATEVFRLTGLAKMLLCDLDAVRRSRGGGRSTIQLPSRVAASDRADFEIYDLDAVAPLSWTVCGDPAKFDRGVYSAADVTRMTPTEDTYAVGVGAFGERFEDCAGEFGELLAVAGTIAVLPTNGASRPDYQMPRGEFVPTAAVLHGIRWTGSYAHLLRFDVDERDRHLSLSDLVDEALTLTNTPAAACVILAETVGLVGAALRKSPTTAAQSASRFDHPEIRDWLSFTPERVCSHSLAVIVGVAVRTPHPPGLQSLAPFLRPLRQTGDIDGHFHAAVFPFQPFKKRKLELDDTVLSLFDSGQLQALLHLLHDERAITGAGESEFLRGACWIGPLAADSEGAR